MFMNFMLCHVLCHAMNDGIFELGGAIISLVDNKILKYQNNLKIEYVTQT